MGGGKRGKEKGPPGRFSRQLEGRGEECQGEYRKRINNCLAAPCVCTERKAFLARCTPLFTNTLAKASHCQASALLSSGEIEASPPPSPLFSLPHPQFRRRPLVQADILHSGKRGRWGGGNDDDTLQFPNVALSISLFPWPCCRFSLTSDIILFDSFFYETFDRNSRTDRILTGALLMQKKPVIEESV